MRSILCAGLALAFAAMVPVPASAQEACPDGTVLVGYDTSYSGGVKTVTSLCHRVPKEKIAKLCAQLSAELEALHERNWEVVELMSDRASELALAFMGKGIEADANDDSEEVVRGYREQLQRVVELREQIDELSGKRAWSKAEKANALKHAYVVTQDSEFDFNGSKVAARGQTWFSDLRRAPKFQGCVTGKNGERYIPQY